MSAQDRHSRSPLDINSCADWIETLQHADGSIPWIERGIWDAWNHGESVMALAIAGRREAALKGLDALKRRQNEDGSWSSELGAGVPMDAQNERLAPPEQLSTVKDSNFSGYVSVVVLRTALALEDMTLLERYGVMVDRAMAFILSLQSPEGDILWRAPDEGQSLDKIDSVRAGNASLYKSLECALRIAETLGLDRSEWHEARQALGHALRHKPHRYDRFALERSRYAMDWYYPVLTGVLEGTDAQAHLAKDWQRFVVDDLGCRCVSDEPWITTAETAELAMACLSVGEREKAEQLLQGLSPLLSEQGGYWMGWQYELGVIWPKERPSWTAGALILALDALYGLSPGSDLLITHAPNAT